MQLSDSPIVTLSTQKRELLERLRQQKGLDVEFPDTIPQRDRSQSTPLSYNQEWMWLLDKFASPAYNNPLTLVLEGRLKVSVLEQSLKEILRRHESLRTRFVRDDSGMLSQTVTLPRALLCDWSLRLKNFSFDAEDINVDDLIDSALLSESIRPFDLSQELPIRAVLFRLSEECHYLHLTLHHIVSDDASYEILLNELSQLYSDFYRGLPASLPKLALQYGDYACWQRSRLAGDEFDRQLSYWREQVESCSSGLSLLGRHQPSESFQGKKHTLALSSALTDSLKRLSQDCEVTLFTTLLTALSTLLYRYTGERDLLLGVPVSGRTRPELSNLIGVFINNLLVRADLSEALSFRRLLERLNQAVLSSRRYQEFPYISLVQSLSPDRELGGDNLVQVLFDYQGTSLPNLELPDLKTRVFELDTGFAKVNLTLHLAEVSGELQGYFEYRTDVFSAEEIARLAAHFEILLQGIVTSPDVSLHHLPLLSAAERREQLSIWNATDGEYPAEKCIHELFEAQVEQCSDAIALTFGTESLTYGELNERAELLARYLRSLGVGPDQLVGICLERSVDMVVGLLGILKAGGAYVPLDPAYPRERVRAMLRDSGALVVVVSESSVASDVLSDVLSELPDRQVVRLDQDWPEISSFSPVSDGEPFDVLPVRSQTASPANLAYIIFTSGSTGKPKGVQITHGSAVNFLNSMSLQPGLSAEDTMLAVTTISFDISVLELYLPLMVGAKVVLASREEAMDGTRLRSLLRASGATMLQATPASWNLLLASGWVQADAPSLKMLCGGEALLPSLASQLLARGDSVWNLYGPTETTVWTTCHQVLANDLLTDLPTDLLADPANSSRESREISRESAVLIGRPLPNMQAYILDSERQLLPVGATGELCLSGVGVGRGYLNRPELTAEKFIAHPFREGVSLYCTGDLARYRPDGAIEYLGRSDHQVKVRGFRIELGEIEATLSQYPAIRQGVVIAREDEPGDQRLVAYWVPAAANIEVSTSDLRQFLKQTLPDYMVPSAFVQMDALPLTPNGKVNRPLLPKPDSSLSLVETELVAPRDDWECQLAEIWQKVLDIPAIGVKQNFFDLGGHSLLAVHLFADIQKIFDQALPLTTLFQAPTIEELARLLRQPSGAIPPDCSLVPLQAGGTQAPLFLVPPAGATVVNLGRLVRYLEPEQPVYGLEPLGMDGRQFPHTDLREMAAYYVQEIRKLQPQGPYFWAGRCFGGVVAFEMAQQLRSQGQRVALLAILDTGLPPTCCTETTMDAVEKSTEKSGRQLVAGQQLASQQPSQQPEVKKSIGYYYHRLTSGYYLQRLIARQQRGELTPAFIRYKVSLFLEGTFNDKTSALFLTVVEKAEAGHPLFSLFQKVMFSRLPQFFTAAAHRKARRDYVTSPYTGVITLFRNADSSNDIQSQWSKLTSSSVECHTVPGNHMTMLRVPEYAKVVADKLTSSLENARAEVQVEN